jgi:ABC-type maltose transport system permease subunit
MKIFRTQIICACLLIILSFSCNASNNNITSPEAPKRTFIQNYKDMVLAHCIANAYQEGEIASMDAGISGLEEWTYYDLEESPQAVHHFVIIIGI